MRLYSEDELDLFGAVIGIVFSLLALSGVLVFHDTAAACVPVCYLVVRAAISLWRLYRRQWRRR